MTHTRFCRLGPTCARAFGAAAVSAEAQLLDDLKRDHATADNVLTRGIGYANQRHSELKRIDEGNVAKPVPVWNHSLNNSQSHESQPIVQGGVMYVTTHPSTVAIDAHFIGSTIRWPSSTPGG